MAKKKTKKIILKKDIVIPKGTVFECIDGLKREYCNGNYEILINLSRDNYGSFVIGSDFDKKNFEFKEV
ncbi:hypothetical protein KAX02_05545 [candidate division WOR-3 bacterium]|nr:hypothetical protein [candidate division WOR-3 bacterium]